MTKNSCCGDNPQPQSTKKAEDSCCGPNPQKRKIDWLLWGSLSICALSFFVHYTQALSLEQLNLLAANITMLVNKMWWGLGLGILFVGLLSQVPREFVLKILGDKRGLGGILRATLAGLLLDLCNHGILLVGMKLYERGASTAQTMAFLIASPWNSFSLTLILWALIGLPWTLAFVFCSGLVAIFAGLIIEQLESRGVLPANPNRTSLRENFDFFSEAKKSLGSTTWNFALARKIFLDGIKDSRMIVRWILFGSVLAGLIQTFVSTHHMQLYFGPSALGLALTLLAATVIEVCSEGSTPIAADLLNRAQAPGNAFAFLMTGAATDYTEILAIREQTKSWKVALFLPLVTVPQVILIAYLMNHL